MIHLNPYIAGDPIRSEQSFFGREDIFKKVKNVLSNSHNNAVVLYGQRRIGKTSILLQLESQLLHDGIFTPVYFDLHDKASKPLRELLYDLAASICKVTGKEVPPSELFDEAGEFFRMKFLPLAAKAASKRGIVLLFDEFDVLDSPSRIQAGESFFPYLRQWMTEIEAVRFVFVIGRRPDDLSTDTLQTFKSLRAMRVSRLDRPSAEAMIKQSEKEGSLFWPDTAVEQLWEICQGHSYFTQLMCSVIFEKVYDTAPSLPAEVSVEHVQDSIADALDQGANAFHWIWAGLPPAERVVIAAMAEVESQIITQEELIERLNLSGVRLIVRELELAPETLVEWELLQQLDGGYGFVAPLFKRWVVKNRPLRRVKDELDRLDPLAEGLFQTGQSYYGLGQLTEAENQLRESRRINPNHLKSGLLLGRILLEKGQAEESVAVLEEAYKYDEGAARAELIRALLAIADDPWQGEPEQISIYERIINIDRNQSLARERLDQLLHERRLRELSAKADLALEMEAEQKWATAINIYQELLTEVPDNTEWNLRLSEAIESEINTLLGWAESYEATEEWSRAASIYKSLATHYAERGDWESRLLETQARAQLAETYNLALGTLENGDKDTARRLLADVIYQQPDYKEAARFLLMAITDIDVNWLLKELQESDKAEPDKTRPENHSSTSRNFMKLTKTDDPEKFVYCTECAVPLKAKNLTRHFIQHHDFEMDNE